MLFCSVVVWNIATKEAICGSPAQALSAGLTHALAYSNTSDDVFITGGKLVTIRFYLFLYHDNFECLLLSLCDLLNGSMSRNAFIKAGF